MKTLLAVLLLIPLLAFAGDGKSDQCLTVAKFAYLAATARDKGMSANRFKAKVRKSAPGAGESDFQIVFTMTDKIFASKVDRLTIARAVYRECLSEEEV